jgi:hypothetical protein
LQAQRKIEHVQWLRDRRADTYISLLRVGQAMCDEAIIMAASAAPPGWSPEETDTSEFRASIVAFGSGEVAGLYDNFLDALREARKIQRDHLASPPRKDSTAQFQVQQAVDTLVDALKTISERIAQELQSPF